MSAVADATAGYALFATSIGHCAIAWNARGLTSLQLPAASREATARLMRTRSRGTALRRPPPFVRAAIRAIRALLAGRPQDLSRLPVDLEGLPPFQRRVYERMRSLRPGETCSYGELARRAGSAGAARAVGQAMRRNPLPLVIPCHRVLAAGGTIGGFSAPGGTRTKERLLAIERAQAVPAAVSPSAPRRAGFPAQRGTGSPPRPRRAGRRRPA
jgi:methylated-DNA-[protein]-cysteine S-methyltransferase